MGDSSSLIQDIIDTQQLRDAVVAIAKAMDEKRLDDWVEMCTEDIELIMHLEPGNPVIVRGKASFCAALEALRRYDATTHLVGNVSATVVDDSGETEACCLAHHLLTKEGRRTNLRMAVRYRDRFKRVAGRWMMKSRNMAVDWTELSPSEIATFS